MADRELTDTQTVTWDGSVPTEAKANVVKQMSIVSDLSGLKLEGDSAAPGASKVYGTDGAGVKGWRAESGSGGGGGLILVEKKVITSDQTTVTFSGLDGDAHEVYTLIGRIKLTATGAIVLRPNGVTTNLTSSQNATAGGSNFAAGTNTWRFLNSNNGDVYSFTLTINAAKAINSVAMTRGFYGHAGGFNGSNAVSFTSGGRWNETTNNITSLDIVSEVASGIGNGSSIALYRYAQS